MSDQHNSARTRFLSAFGWLCAGACIALALTTQFTASAQSPGRTNVTNAMPTKEGSAGTYSLIKSGGGPAMLMDSRSGRTWTLSDDNEWLALPDARRVTTMDDDMPTLLDPHHQKLLAGFSPLARARDALERARREERERIGKITSAILKMERDIVSALETKNRDAMPDIERSLDESGVSDIEKTEGEKNWEKVLEDLAEQERRQAEKRRKEQEEREKSGE